MTIRYAEDFLRGDVRICRVYEVEDRPVQVGNKVDFMFTPRYAVDRLFKLEKYQDPLSATIEHRSSSGIRPMPGGEVYLEKIPKEPKAIRGKVIRISEGLYHVDFGVATMPLATDAVFGPIISVIEIPEASD